MSLYDFGKTIFAGDPPTRIVTIYCEDKRQYKFTQSKTNGGYTIIAPDLSVTTCNREHQTLTWARDWVNRQ